MVGSSRRKRWKPSPLGAKIAEAHAAAAARPDPAPAEVPSGEQTRFLGGYTLPPIGGRQRQRIGKDLGEIRVEDGVLTLRAVRQPPGRYVPEIYLRPDDVEAAAPIQLNYVGSNRGVALRLDDGEHGYIWTDQPAELLARMAAEGFETSDEPVAARGIVG